MEELDVCLRDGLPVFRALSNLSLKPSINLPSEGLFELTLPPMRSRIFALHLLLTILNNHLNIFFMHFSLLDQQGQAQQFATDILKTRGIHPLPPTPGPPHFDPEGPHPTVASTVPFSSFTSLAVPTPSGRRVPPTIIIGVKIGDVSL